MSGYDVCRKIREKYSPGELPVIMLTAKNQLSNLLEGLNSGANDYLAKPFSSEELLERIKVHIQLVRANRDLKGAHDKLEDYNRNLEKKVIERTRQLNEKNKLILDSMNFAQRIQMDILPHDENSQTHPPKFMVPNLLNSKVSPAGKVAHLTLHRKY